MPTFKRCYFVSSLQSRPSLETSLCRPGFVEPAPACLLPSSHRRLPLERRPYRPLWPVPRLGRHRAVAWSYCWLGQMAVCCVFPDVSALQSTSACACSMMAKVIWERRWPYSQFRHSFVISVVYSLYARFEWYSCIRFMFMNIVNLIND